MLDLLGNGRPAGDILSRTVRITLGGKEYSLPVRSIKANREWLAKVNGQTVALLKGLDTSGDDLGALMGLLGNQIDPLIDLLLAYDSEGVLPTRDEIESIEPDASLDVLEAVQGVWRAANPLVGTSITSMTTGEALGNVSSVPTSSPPRNGAGRRSRSKKN
jgi:hypothetical protein